MTKRIDPANGHVTKEQARTVASQLFRLIRQLSVGDDAAVAELPLAQLRVCGILHGGPPCRRSAANWASRSAR